MFGRVIVNKPELKFKEFDTYRAHYCGLCKSLKKEGILCALSLNFDITFLSLLLNSLYEPDTKEEKCRCICHLCKKHTELSDQYNTYASHMTIILSYYKCIDDFKDDKNIVKYLYSLYLKPKVSKIEKLYPKKCENIKSYLRELTLKETDASLEECANLFGKLLGEIFTPKEDLWYDILYSLGFHLGKFIYIADAYEDIAADIKHNRPNPLKSLYQSPDFHRECGIILNMMAAELAREFEKLPLERNVNILRNIIYAGIWHNLEGDKK